MLPQRNTGLITDTRPISVTNSDNRILSAAVAHAVMPAVLDFIDPAQKGFLAGRSGADHVSDINNFFYEGLEKGEDRYLFLLDTAKAFDSIDHEWIHGINKDKSFVLTTSPVSHYPVIRAGSPWPDLARKERGTHLGIMIGRDVTLVGARVKGPLQN